LARLKVTTDADESMPLDQVPEDARCRVVEKKVWRLRSLFETDLRTAFEYLDDLRTHEAWKYLREPDMERLVENRCRVTSAFVEQLRSGYASLISAGHTGKVTATQAAAAAFAEDKAKTVRQLAAEVGCSKSTAQRAMVSHEVDSLPEKRDTAADESAATGLSTATIYRQRRLKADHPDLWAQVEAGEKSTHAAAIEAGIVKVPSVLEQLRKLWARATDADRCAFMKEAHGWVIGSK
jgi:AraC-like DNA-binding protein